MVLEKRQVVQAIDKYTIVVVSTPSLLAENQNRNFLSHKASNEQVGPKNNDIFRWNEVGSGPRPV